MAAARALLAQEHYCLFCQGEIVATHRDAKCGNVGG